MNREIKVTLGTNMRVDAEYKGFTVHTDQPVHQGGEDSAPSPFDLFLVSLAACAGYFLLVFCRQRQIPTEHSTVTLKTERNPENKMIDHMIIEASLPPSFPEKYVGAAVKAMETCTVKKHMESPPRFTTRALIREE